MHQLISWTRSNWGEAEASAIADINRDSGAEVFAGQVSEEFDIALHEALLKDLPEGTIRFLVRHDAFPRFTYKLPDYTAVPLMERPDGLIPGRKSPYT